MAASTYRGSINALWCLDSGAEEGRPLFHPCKCSGSIKYIHQDCLLEWIRFSNQSEPKCELCGEQFSFTPVYREGAPQQLPVQEFVSAMIPHAGDAIRRAFRVFLLVFLWIVVLPVITSYAIDICNVFVFQETLQLDFSPSELWHAFWNGLLECILLVGLSTAVTHVWDGILRDARAHNELGQQPLNGQRNGIIELFGRQWVPFDLAAPDANAPEIPDATAQEAGHTAPEQQEVAANDAEPAQHVLGDTGVNDDGEEGDRDSPHNATADHDETEAVEPVDETDGQGPEDVANAAHAPEQLPPEQVEEAVILPWEDNPHEEEEPWIAELFDFDRPVTGSIVRWLRMCLYNISFILAFEVCPVQVGRTILANMGVTLSDVILPVQTDKVANEANSTQATHLTEEAADLGISQTEKLNMVMVHEYVTRRAFAGVCGAIGYGLIVLAVLAIYCTYVAVQCSINERYRRRHIRRALSVVSSVFKWYKVASMVLVKGFIIPLFMGAVLNIVTLKTCNATLEERVYRCQTVPLGCGLMHWVIGVCFVLHVTSCTTELRKILRSDILAGVLPVEPDPGANLIDTLASRPFTLFVQQSCFSLGFYIVALLLCVFLPVRIGHVFVPFAQPLQLRFEGLFLEIQLPFELLLSHIVLPLVLERVNYRSVIGIIERTFMSSSCAILGLEDVLEPDEQHAMHEVQQPTEEPTAQTPQEADNEPDTAAPNVRPWWYPARRFTTSYMSYWLRYTVLVLWTMFATVVAFSWAIRLPLEIGRTTLSLVHLPAGQDFYNFALGLAMLGIVNVGLHYIWRECLAQADIAAAVRIGVKWVWVLAKVLLLAALWLTVIPLMLGVIFELVLVIPLRLPVDETPKLPIAQCWALGLVSLKIWVRLVMLGAFGDTLWKRRFDRVRQNGVMNVQFWETVTEILVPMFIGVGDYLFVPYLFGKLAATSSFTSIPLASRVFRYSFAFYLALRVLLEVAELAIEQFRRMHDQIRDKRYLLGLELSNRAAELTQPETIH